MNHTNFSFLCSIAKKGRRKRSSFFYLMALFGLVYFRAYVEQLMNINMSLCIIYMFVNVIYEKTVYKCIIFVSENL